jgi:hypothetical protein
LKEFLPIKKKLKKKKKKKEEEEEEDNIYISTQNQKLEG